MSNIQTVLNMNLDKQKDNNQMSSLVQGDKVRATTVNNPQLHKGTDPKWSDKVFEVDKVKGNTITLNEGTVYKRNDLLKVPADTQTTGRNAIDAVKAELLRLKARAKAKANPDRYKNKEAVRNLIKTAMKHHKSSKEAKEKKEKEKAEKEQQPTKAELEKQLQLNKQSIKERITNYQPKPKEKAEPLKRPKRQTALSKLKEFLEKSNKEHALKVEKAQQASSSSSSKNKS